MKKKKQEKVDAKTLANRDDQRIRYAKRMEDPEYRELIRAKRRRLVEEMTPEEAERQRAQIRERVRRFREKERLELEKLSKATKKKVGDMSPGELGDRINEVVKKVVKKSARKNSKSKNR